MKKFLKVSQFILLFLILLCTTVLLVINAKSRALKKNENRTQALIIEKKKTLHSLNVVEDLQELQEFNDSQIEHFFSPEIDIISIGSELTQRIKSNHLYINFYNLYRKDHQDFFNYSIEGRITNCLELLRSLSRDKKYYYFDSITIDASDENVIMTLNIAPLIFDKAQIDLQVNKDKMAIPEHLLKERRKDSVSSVKMASRLFYTPDISKAPPKIPEKKPEVQSTPEVEIPPAPGWLSYVGHSVEEGKPYDYFLDKRTNKTIEVSPDIENSALTIIEYLDSGFYVLISGEKYYVSKN